MANTSSMMLILILWVAAFAEAAERLEWDCPEPDGLFPHPTQCDRYFHCRNGIVNRKLCADGLVFDPDKDATFEEPCDLVQERYHSELVIFIGKNVKSGQNPAK